MEEYLQCMNTLRSQMNDVEDQAAKSSVEEQMLITTIQTMEADLDSAVSEGKKIKEETDKMIQEKGRICMQILEKQKKIASLESDSCTLMQTLELIQQERVSLSLKFSETRQYYIKVADDLKAKLEQQKDWIKCHGIHSNMGAYELVEDNNGKGSAATGGGSTVEHITMDILRSNSKQNLMAAMDSAKKRLDEVVEIKFQQAEENSKVKHSLQEVRCRVKEFKPELLAMNIKSLEEEYEALLSDKAGELEYLQSLQEQIEKLKGIFHVIKCACGNEYQISNLCA